MFYVTKERNDKSMKVGIFGTGAYGLSLTSILMDNGIEVTMWTKFEEEKNLLNQTRKNEKLLPNFTLDSSVTITTSVEECAKNKDLLIIAIPLIFIHDLCQELKKFIRGEEKICIASKGIEQNTLLFAHEIITKYIDTSNIAVLSGPSFAKDIILKKPIGLTLATNSVEIRKIIQDVFVTDYIKIDDINDIIGTEICGAVKNVMAIASGILAGLGVSDSTKAMFLTKSLKDIQMIIDEFGGNIETSFSYAGIGDLILTCNSEGSRNYTFGKLLGKSGKKEEIDAYLKNTTVEGYYTLHAVYELFRKNNLCIPMIDILYNIVNENGSPKKILECLCSDS